MACRNGKRIGNPCPYAAGRLEQYGPNELQEGGRKSVLRIFLEQFADFLVIILILAVYALYAWARGRTSDEGLRLLGFAVVAALMLFMVANKVFSSQYLVWIAAPVAFLVASRSGRTERRMFWLTVLTLVLTQLNFAYNIGYLGGGENINDLGMMVILARNIAAKKSQNRPIPITLTA